MKDASRGISTSHAKAKAGLPPSPPIGDGTNGVSAVGWRPQKVRRSRIEPRGLRRPDAATYVGVSESKFQQMVDEGQMPQSIKVGGCKMWDRFDLDIAFDALKTEHSEWDDVRN